MPIWKWFLHCEGCTVLKSQNTLIINSRVFSFSIYMPTAENQLLRWNKIMKMAAELMRDLHKRGFEITLAVVEHEGKPHIRSKIIHRAKEEGARTK